MKQFEIWTEGNSFKTPNGAAIFHGVFEAETFKDAVYKYIDTLFDYQKPLFSYNNDELKYNECKFFDNGKDARKIFG
jgi:hypothetical protein